ncbi:asparaginase [Arthrobacter sp. Sa2BUA2]|uniref:asparaginase n=1 Tax=Arthrobacter pullicola TaxID=2762224 RepID=A0ABR8YLJ7_9MICC|nr:asparaginase [Arthrobacter pullicola]MBD8045107.1 asparaginase [Arthrobacter pullicola]
MAHIRIMATGGTIASRTGKDGATSAERAEEVAAGLSGRHGYSVQDLTNVNSFQLRFSDVRGIAEAVRDAVADEGVDGVVITHGTDTMEETAFLLDLVHESPKPVVFTGAQRTADSAGADGPANLEEAVAAAAASQLRGAGVLISFAGQVFAARGTRKTHTMAASPFSGGVPVAHFIAGTLHVSAIPVRPAALPLPGEDFDNAQVEIIQCALGTTPDLFTFAVRSGANAVVLAGTGAGNAGAGFAEAVQDAVRGGCPVILCSRVPAGPVVPAYGAGGGVDLVRAGAIPSGDLGPSQARMLAALLTSLPATQDEILQALTSGAARSSG